ncbi:hypothetical protein [Rheinheimera hassiensis]|uniref:hypothetical protein n=1 Tax=Rheinheimera hassiensis TaxID=1193627 RepID=UPI001F067B99|nr:hypothetical protein [Rheinheimera hassiensis]
MKKLLPLLLILTALVYGCSKPDEDFHFEINERDIKHSEKIQDAGSVLSQLCPAVKKAEHVYATYQLDVIDDSRDLLGYRSREYGWTYDIEFRIKDNKSRHTHWIYVGGDANGINGFLVVGKQESLDFCKIKATMRDNYFLPVSVYN